MTLNLKMILELEARAAKAELDAAAKSIKGITAATSELTGKSKTSATATDASTAAAKRAAVANRDLASSQRTAAGATGNLAAQFNDIGVMLAAGQNPLQLVIQQGTQISQAFGNAGAGGAANLLKQGLLSMISPVNLITIGVIAAGAATIQWLTSSGAEAKNLEDRLSAVNDAVAEWRDQSAKSAADLQKEFGAITPEIVALQRELLAIDVRRISIEAAEASRAMRQEFGAIDVEDILGLKRVNARQMFPQVAELRTLMDEAARASNPADQANGWGQVATLIRESLGGVGQMSLEQLAFYNSVVNTEAALRSSAVATGDVEAGLGNAADQANVVEAATLAIADAIRAAASGNLAAVFSGAIPAANGLLGVTKQILGRLGSIASAYAKYGPSGVIPGTDVKKGTFSYGGMDAVARGEAAKRPSPFGRLAGGAGGVRSFGCGGGGGGGGGAGAAQAEADALQNLITKLNDEITALQTQDPIQQEMLKYREALAGATDAERKQVEALIIAREKEALAVEGMKASKEFFEQTALNALDGLITKGESLQDVLKGVAAAFLKAAIQGALFGQGPFGAMFGGKSILSGLFGGGKGGGGLLAGLFGGKAEGGMIYGRGTGKSDSELRALSVGEYVVNAKATARNRHTLEAINAGSSIPGLAGGGMVDNRNRKSGMSPSGTGSGGNFSAHFDLRGVKGDREIEASARRGMKEALTEYDRGTLPTSMRRVSRDSSRIG